MKTIQDAYKEIVAYAKGKLAKIGQEDVIADKEDVNYIVREIFYYNELYDDDDVRACITGGNFYNEAEYDWECAEFLKIAYKKIVWYYVNYDKTHTSKQKFHPTLLNTLYWFMKVRSGIVRASAYKNLINTFKKWIDRVVLKYKKEYSDEAFESKDEAKSETEKRPGIAWKKVFISLFVILTIAGMAVWCVLDVRNNIRKSHVKELLSRRGLIKAEFESLAGPDCVEHSCK